MKTYLIVAIAMLNLAACSKQTEEKTVENAEQKTEQKAEVKHEGEVVTKDLVCDMEGKNDIFHVHENKTYLFCNDGCKEDFKKDPAKYLAAKVPADSSKKM